MLLGVSKEKYAGLYKLYRFKCDFGVSSKCLKEWSRRGNKKVLSSNKHCCKPCHNAAIASKGGKAGGPISGKNAALSGQCLRALSIAHEPQNRQKANETKLKKGKANFTSNAENLVYEECLKRFREVKRWHYLQTPFGLCSIDLYIPSQNLFIEVDGTYWHGLDQPYDKLEERIRKNLIEIDS
jgi:very-short-patch-repair endonuclease